MTKRVVLIGHPVAHSLSGAMQQAAFDALGIDATYELWDRAPIALRHEVFREGKPLLVRDPGALFRFRLESSREYLDTIPLRRMFEEAFFRRVRRNGFARQASHR